MTSKQSLHEPQSLYVENRAQVIAKAITTWESHWFYNPRAKKDEGVTKLMTFDEETEALYEVQEKVTSINLLFYNLIMVAQREWKNNILEERSFDIGNIHISFYSSMIKISPNNFNIIYLFINFYVRFEPL